MNNLQEEAKASTAIKTEISKSTERVESTHKKLSEDLTRQMREENAKLREALNMSLFVLMYSPNTSKCTPSKLPPQRHV
jgi:flagellar biosynthesis GTPase FlhF